jgi:hypothetical protein
MFLDVGFERNESLVNEVGDTLIRIAFGFQPSTCASGGRGGKIDQKGFGFSLGLRQRGIDITDPIDEHRSPPEMI